MSHKHENSEDREARRRAKEKSRKQNRASRRNEATNKVKKALNELRGAIKKSGLTKTQLSDFSGVDATCLNNISKGRNLCLQLSSFIAVANACGYDVKMIKKSKEQDEFRAFRQISIDDAANWID